MRIHSGTYKANIWTQKSAFPTIVQKCAPQHFLRWESSDVAKVLLIPEPCKDLLRFSSLCRQNSVISHIEAPARAFLCVGGKCKPQPSGTLRAHKKNTDNVILLSVLSVMLQVLFASVRNCE